MSNHQKQVRTKAGFDTWAGKKAWMIPDNVIQLGELNTVDGKLSFTLKFGGDIKKGTYTLADGVPTFTEASAASTGTGD